MKFTVKQQAPKGQGIYAAQQIATGGVVAAIQYVREITIETPRRINDPFEHQTYLPDGRVFLVAEPYCYFNHSCEPSAWLFSANQQYYVIAKNDIAVGNEITVDYELSAIDAQTWQNVCGDEPSLRECKGVSVNRHATLTHQSQ